MVTHLVFLGGSCDTCAGHCSEGHTHLSDIVAKLSLCLPIQREEGEPIDVDVYEQFANGGRSIVSYSENLNLGGHSLGIEATYQVEPAILRSSALFHVLNLSRNACAEMKS